MNNKFYVCKYNYIEMRNLSILFLFAISFLSFKAMAQSDDKELADFKKKIEMTIRRLDMRIDKVNDDHKKTNSAEVIASSNEFKKKMEDQRVILKADLERLPQVKKENWKTFVEEVTEHMKDAKESAKPIVL